VLHVQGSAEEQPFWLMLLSKIAYQKKKTKTKKTAAGKMMRSRDIMT